MTADTFDLATLPRLTERRGADRTRMASMLQSLAESHGCTVDRTADRRAIFLDVEAPGGLAVYLDFDGESCQPDTHVVSWHVRGAPGPVDVRLSSAVFGAHVNPCHGQKATHVANGFAPLYLHLDRVLRAAVDGSAYRAA